MKKLIAFISQADLTFQFLQFIEDGVANMLSGNILKESALFIEVLKKVKVEFGQIDKTYMRVNGIIEK